MIKTKIHHWITFFDENLLPGSMSYNKIGLALGRILSEYKNLKNNKITEKDVKCLLLMITQGL